MIGGIKLPLMAKPFKVLISWFLETSFTSKFNWRMFLKDLPSLNNLKCFEKKQMQARWFVSIYNCRNCSFKCCTKLLIITTIIECYSPLAPQLKEPKVSLQSI